MSLLTKIKAFIAALFGKGLEPPLQKETPDMSAFAVKKTDRYIDTLFVHCSDSPHSHHDDISVIENWHKARGFDGVGYHWFIKSDGTIQEGRSVHRIPAAQKGHNTGSLAVCLHGRNEFTEQQFKSLLYLANECNKLYTGLRVRAHNEVDEGKTCPNFHLDDALPLTKNGRLRA